MPPPPLPSVSLLIFLLLWQPGCRGFTVAPPHLPRSCFAAALSICTVGNTLSYASGRRCGSGLLFEVLLRSDGFFPAGESRGFQVRDPALYLVHGKASAMACLSAASSPPSTPPPHASRFRPV